MRVFLMTVCLLVAGAGAAAAPDCDLAGEVSALRSAIDARTAALSASEPEERHLRDGDLAWLIEGTLDRVAARRPVRRVARDQFPCSRMRGAGKGMPSARSAARIAFNTDERMRVRCRTSAMR